MLEWNKFYHHTKDRPPWERLIRAASLVPNKEDALDLGSGAGRDTRYLLEQGFSVTAVDMEAGSIAILKTLPQERLRVVQSSFVDFPFETYDLINAHFALPFLSPARFDEVFDRLKHALRPAGIFVGQFFGVHDQWNVPGRDMTFFTREQAEERLQRLEVIELEEENIDSFVADGSPKHWHVFHILARKK